MFINFTVGNFRSFKEPRTLSMEATSITERNESIIQKSRYKLLPSVVLYGANSSGKSNLLLALAFMKQVLLDSVKLNPEDDLKYDPFMLSNVHDQPTYFEMEFLIDTTKFRYGYKYSLNEINEEWLYEQREGEREYKLFYRLEGDMDISKTRFKEGLDKDESTPKNRLFLSLVAQLNGEISKQIIKWFKNYNYVSGIDSDGYERFTVEMLYRHKEGSKEALAFFRKLNLGFEDLSIHEIDFQDIKDGSIKLNVPEEIKQIFEKKKGSVLSVSTKHKIFDESGMESGYKEFDEGTMESEGTKKIIKMSGPIFNTLLFGRLLLIDELDAKLHPMLTRQIILLFNNPETNPKGAQLIFITHDTTLLSGKIFRRDQIWFTAKDKTDASDLFSLVEFKDIEGNKIRKDSSFAKNYINGRYGAIPYFNNIDLWD